MCCQRAAADSRCRLHQSIFIFTCAASRCLESVIIVHQSHRRRSGTVDLRFKMIIFKSCPIGPDRLHAACPCAVCRARCLELRLPFITVDHSCQTDRVWQLCLTAFCHEPLFSSGGHFSTRCSSDGRRWERTRAEGSRRWTSRDWRAHAAQWRAQGQIHFLLH